MNKIIKNRLTINVLPQRGCESHSALWFANNYDRGGSGS